MVYKWDEMARKQRDLLITKTFGFTSEDFFIFAWESGAFNYSTNILWTWSLVEKMHQLKFLFSLYNSVSAGYIAEFLNRATLERYDASFIPTASEAICKAALKAVGVEIE